MAGARTPQSGARSRLSRCQARTRRPQDADQQNGSERCGRIGSDCSHRVVQVCSCQVVRKPPCACSSGRKDSTRRHDDAIVQPHPGGLKTFGLLPDAIRGLPFDRKVETLLLGRSDVALIVRPMLVAWLQLREQIVAFDKAIRVLVKANSACRLLMSVPGIGVLSSLAYVSTVEDPARFGRSRSVGVHLGLTPRQYQSGEVDRSGRISRCGDTLARTLLYEAAVVILSRVKRASSLKDWACAIAKRSGNGKARVALARNLSVILHSIWRSGEPFRWSEHARAA
jgi:transposase